MGRQRQEDHKFKPTLGKQFSKILSQWGVSIGDIAQCKGGGFNHSTLKTKTNTQNWLLILIPMCLVCHYT